MTQQYQERYARQELIKDWDQKKLTDSRVCILGSDMLSEFVNLGLAALGIGEIRIITSAKNGKGDGILGKFKNYTNYDGNEKASIFAYVLKKINPGIEIIDLHTEIFNEGYFPLLNNPKVVIDTTNDKKSKWMCMDYCKGNNVPFVSVSAGDFEGIVDVNPDDQKINGHFAFEGQLQNGIVSEVLAGFVVDEVRKILLPLNKNEKVCKRTLRYRLNAIERFI